VLDQSVGSATPWRWLRAALGLLALLAIGRQLAVHVQLRLDLVNFFSYFTNLSNLFAAAVLILGARGSSPGRDASPAMNNCARSRR